MRTLPGWFVLMWLIVGLGAANTSADDSLPVNVRADMLAQEIVAAAKAGNDKQLLDAITRYRVLESQGHRTPPTILFHEAKAAKRTGDLERTKKAIESYLSVADRSDRNYAAALQLYSQVKRAADADVPRSRMVLRAIQESWVDVRDARDNKLLYENMPSGHSIAIEGVAPFSVFLGNAEGVRVEFNGQNFDISRYKRGPAARFTLGDEKAVNN